MRVPSASAVLLLATLGNELMAMFEELMEQEPRNEVPAQTREAAPLELQL
jgi:hypothetical protein